ncbi:L-threonylcarbamoyladenylate synthase [Simonsiella muelleri]|jgi:hypothetical protein|uniref:L-threonylcarbamoyladenylate synthase n=1 Tax=Simonsiella muelleri TaxID=72 RepID=UPI0023F22E4B|nr:L-threonylcarbamoyladenylate synthase [Simonsiella muelleri]
MQRINAYTLRAHLKRGGVIAYPTEFCYGLGCLPNHIVGIRRILHIKKRPQHKGLITIGQNFRQLAPLLKRLPENDIQQYQQIWQTDPPTTLILPARASVLPLLRGRGRGSLAVRVPRHDVARQVCWLAKNALVSTSCNRAKKRPCRTERETRRQFGRDVLIIGGKTGGYKQPSQIMNPFSAERLR